MSKEAHQAKANLQLQHGLKSHVIGRQKGGGRMHVSFLFGGRRGAQMREKLENACHHGGTVDRVALQSTSAITYTYSHGVTKARSW